jgi:hypothetical protein
MATNLGSLPVEMDGYVIILGIRRITFTQLDAFAHLRLFGFTAV